jgi:hypothetical protein
MSEKIPIGEKVLMKGNEAMEEPNEREDPHR